jgi:hypothetical protein
MEKNFYAKFFAACAFICASATAAVSQVAVSEPADKQDFYSRRQQPEKQLTIAPEKIRSYRVDPAGRETAESLISRRAVSRVRAGEVLPEKSTVADSAPLPADFDAECAPANDNICSAQAAALDEIVTFDNTCAGVEEGEPVPGPGTSFNGTCNSQDGWCEFELGIQNTVWFTFVAPESGAVTISSWIDEFPYDTQLALYSASEGCDGELTLVGANDDAAFDNFSSFIIASCLEPGATYYVQVDGFDGFAGTGGIYIAPSVALAPEIYVLGSTTLCEGQSVGLYVAYYSTEGNILWSNGETTQIIFVSEPGEYSVTVDCATSEYSVTIEAGEGPANDDLCSAQPLVVGELTAFDNTCATAEEGEVVPGPGTDPMNGSCDSQDGWCEFETAIQNSVWFSFVAPESRAVNVASSFDAFPNDTQLALYASDNNSCTGNLTLVAANDDGGEMFSSLINRAYCLTPGATYFVQVDGFGGASGPGTVIVTEVPNTITLCKFLPNGKTTTITVSGCALQAHLAQGASVGPCYGDERSAVEEIAAVNSLSAYPNPTEQFVQLDIEASEAGTALLRLTDAAGREVMRTGLSVTEGNNRTILDLGPVASGIYMLDMNLGETRTSMRIIRR